MLKQLRQRAVEAHTVKHKRRTDLAFRCAQGVQSGYPSVKEFLKSKAPSIYP